MFPVKSIKSIAYILSGSLLYQYNSVSLGWTSGLAAIVGFIIYIVGLDLLKSGLDNTGKKAVNVMRIGAIIGGITGFIDLIPVVNFLAGLGYMAAYVLILVGLFRLKDSATLGLVGREGITRILVAMMISLVAAFINLFPLINYFASFLAVVALVLSLTGWLKVQDGLVQENAEVATLD